MNFKIIITKVLHSNFIQIISKMRIVLVKNVYLVFLFKFFIYIFITSYCNIIFKILNIGNN